MIDHVVQVVLLPDQGIAYFYFDYREQETQTPAAMVATLLRQFAERKDVLSQSLLDYYGKFKQDQPQSSIPELLNVLKNTCLTFSHCYIIVDALDECKMEFRKEILRILKDLGQTGVQLFVTSRPHSHEIQQHIQPAEQIHVEANEADIRTYCHRMMEENEITRELVEGTLRTDVADTISRNAQGM